MTQGTEGPALDPRDDAARFWSGAGVIFGIWVMAGFAGFVLLVILAKDPVKPAPILDREHVEATLGKLLMENKPPAERYAKIGREVERVLSSAQLTDQELRKELEEALKFAKQVSVPNEYMITPIWVEGATEKLQYAIPTLRIEALNDETTPGSRAQVPQSQPINSMTRLSFGSVKAVSARWAAGDPLRLRFSLRDADGLYPSVTLGGDDLELAEDAPLPGAALVLLGEPRALTRGQGRYLARARTKENEVLVAPLLLLRALGAEE